jgi:hypothetical protein
MLRKVGVQVLFSSFIVFRVHEASVLRTRWNLCFHAHMPSLEHLIGCLGIIMCCATVLGVIHSCFSSNLHPNMPTRLAMQSHCLEGEGWAHKMRWSSGQLASISAELAPHAERFHRTCIRRALHIRERITKINEAIKHLACGACSAVVSRTCVAPLERVKMEVILNHEHGNSWRRAVSHIWRDGGVFPVPVFPGQLMQGKTKQQRGSSQTLNDTQIVFLQCPQYLITSRTMFAATGTNKGSPHGLVLICYISILMLVVECHSWSWDPLCTFAASCLQCRSAAEYRTALIVAPSLCLCRRVFLRWSLCLSLQLDVSS